MKSIYNLFTLKLIILYAITVHAQDQLPKIHTTLTDYIEGTANGQPERLRAAFHEDFNLFLVEGDSLQVIDGQGYIDRVEKGKAYNRIGKIISVDVENDAAAAKIEVYFPDGNRRATDYLLLLRSNDQWKIVHKIINLNTFNDIAELQVDNSSELPKIVEALQDYIDGTANSNPDQLHRAFHQDFNLYYIKDQQINVIKGEDYLNNFKEGKKFNRIGKILSIDYEDNAAIGKIQVLMPDRKRIAVDYLLLLKIKQNWKIIHKSFTSKQY